MRDMMETPHLPKQAGVGYKAEFLPAIQAELAQHGALNPIAWFEIHAENYMVAGGAQKAQLGWLRERFPISCHGVGLSIGGDRPLDKDHLARLRVLLDWLKPAKFSEHLAWSSHGAEFLNDLLPLPYTASTLARICDHIDQVQDTLGRQMLLENPSTYVAFAESTYAETDFIAEIAKRTGCGLLLDVNNVFVSATNQQYSPQDYIDEFPLHAVGEIHLGGHTEDEDDHGAPLLIDSHNRQVVDPVWELYAYTLSKTGAKPTLIEWDSDLPEWPVMVSEAARATKVLDPAHV